MSANNGDVKLGTIVLVSGGADVVMTTTGDVTDGMTGGGISCRGGM